MISEYTGLSFNEVMNLPYSLFFIYRKDAWVSAMKKSEEGEKLLKTLWRLNQTKADIKAVREMAGRK